MALVRITVMLIIGIFIYFKLFEHRLIFYPESTIAGVPGIPYEEISFKALDGTDLNAWLIPFEGSPRIFVVSHGNAGNIGDRWAMGEYLHNEFQSTVFMYDYRGYGRSQGQPTESGLYSDLRGATRYVRSRGFAAEHIYLVGQSLGTAVTLDVASQEQVAGILLEAPFPSVSALARAYTFSVPFDYFWTSRFDSLSKLRSIRVPVAVVHGTKDPLIPFALGQQVFDAAHEPKRLFAVEAEIHEGALMALGLERTGELRRFLFREQ